MDNKLVFIHGAGGVVESWHYQRQHFKGADFVSLPGHPGGGPCGSVDEYAVWLHGYVQEKGYVRPILAGHSMGGGIVLQYALQYPSEVGALVLMGTGARLRVAPAILEELKGASQRPEPWVSRIVDNYKLVDRPVSEKVISVRIAQGPEVQYNDMLCCDKFDVIARLGEIKLPVLVVCGSADEMTPVKYTQFLAARIAGAKCVVIEGGTHQVFLEKPDQFNRAVQDFVESLGRKSR